MGIRRYKPTTPGRRGATVSDFAELTPGAKAERPAACRRSGRRPQQPGADHRAASRRRPQAAVPPDRFPPQQGRRAGQRAFDPVRSRTAVRGSPCCTTSTARKAYILAPDGLKVGQRGDERPRRAADGRQLPAAEEHSAGHGDSQHRAAAGPRRAVVPLGRHQRHAGRSRGRLGADQAAQRRNSPRAVGLPGHDRRDRQCGPHERS